MTLLIDQFLAVLNILLPVLAVAGTGFFWARSGRNYPTQEITAFVTLIGTPCLLFHFLLIHEVQFFELVKFMAAVLAVISAVTIASYLILPIFGGDRKALTAAFSFPNVGNVGLPVCFLAFGAAGKSYALIYFSVSAMLMHTIGRWAHQGEASIITVLQSPVLWSVTATLGLIWWREQTGQLLAPNWLMDATKILGGMVIPIVLVSLGVSISKLNISSLPRNLSLSATKFLLGLAIALVLVRLFRFEGVAADIFILQTVMPIAVLNYMFAAMYNNQVKETAALVMTSNLLALITLPVVLWFMV